MGPRAWLDANISYYVRRSTIMKLTFDHLIQAHIDNSTFTRFL